MYRYENRLERLEVFTLLKRAEKGSMDIELALDRAEFEVSSSYNYDIEVFMGDCYDYYCELSDFEKIDLLLQDFAEFEGCDLEFLNAK